ncbi:Sina domain containing protein [Asbolus verrucosus]|uniref:RING-type E3 ubiquitin transferase n=1 Tax=Asbolus verrucosus TaxID=1661398 RepID=A0A482VAB9_ASBVE|nr:Sina domain containing protein [Asbolus verrucosus]
MATQPFSGNITMAVIYLCPADKRLLCSWEGYASDIKQHFEKEHNGLLFHTNSVEIDLNILHENRLLHLEDEIYLIQSYVEDNKLCLTLRYLGPSEMAARMHYDVAITVGGVFYKYEEGRKFSCVTPTVKGWEIDLESLEKFHGKLQALMCTVLIEDNGEIRRKVSDVSLEINNSFVERNACDETEASILEALNFIDGKIERLKMDKSSDDIMDKISHLNLTILEEPFNEGRKYSSEESRSDHLMEILPDIPEELNLSCSSCTLDMLPPIYLCINGHSVCSWCKRNPCKICNGIITPARNTDLENISRTHKHLCRYSSDGCSEKLLYNEVRGHEARCRFCKYRCSSGCCYEAKFQDLIYHLRILHTSVKISRTMRNEFPKNTEMYVASRSIGIFYCKSEQQGEVIAWTATFCGPKERQFFCELTFKGSKFKEPVFMKRRDNVYEIAKSVAELKKMKAKEKYAVLTITSYDN